MQYHIVMIFTYSWAFDAVLLRRMLMLPYKQILLKMFVLLSQPDKAR